METDLYDTETINIAEQKSHTLRSNVLDELLEKHLCSEESIKKVKKYYEENKYIEYKILIFNIKKLIKKYEKMDNISFLLKNIVDNTKKVKELINDNIYDNYIEKINEYTARIFIELNDK